MTAPTYVKKGNSPRTIVLLHGIGAGAEMFSPQLDGLSNDFTVVAWNMPGYGKTPLSAEPMSFAGLSQGLLDLLDDLGIKRANLLGHSIGGMIAQDFYARYPARVASLVLSATTSAFGSRDGAFQKKFVEDRLAPLEAGKTIPELAEAFVPALVGSRGDPTAIPAAIAAMSRLSSDTYRNVINCLATFDRRAELADIAVPTLLIAGGEDRNGPAETMRKMAEAIEGATFECLPGIGHLAPLEAPGAYNALLLKFYAGAISGEAS